MNREDKISVPKDVSASVKDSSKKKTKKKRKKRKTYSSSDSSDSEERNKRERKKRKISTSSDSSDSYHHKKKKKKHKHKHKKDKDKSKKVKKEVKIIKPNDDSSTENVDRILLDRAKAMAPMTKEEWEKRQNVVRRVYDKETNRHRLIKGDGEVIEEIVSKERHAEINRKATKGDGEFFQSRVSTFSSR